MSSKKDKKESGRRGGWNSKSSSGYDRQSRQADDDWRKKYEETVTLPKVDVEYLEKKPVKIERICRTAGIVMEIFQFTPDAEQVSVKLASTSLENIDSAVELLRRECYHGEVRREKGMGSGSGRKRRRRSSRDRGDGKKRNMNDEYRRDDFDKRRDNDYHYSRPRKSGYMKDEHSLTVPEHYIYCVTGEYAHKLEDIALSTSTAIRISDKAMTETGLSLPRTITIMGDQRDKIDEAATFIKQIVDAAMIEDRNDDMDFFKMGGMQGRYPGGNGQPYKAKGGSGILSADLFGTSGNPGKPLLPTPGKGVGLLDMMSTDIPPFCSSSVEDTRGNCDDIDFDEL